MKEGDVPTLELFSKKKKQIRVEITLQLVEFWLQPDLRAFFDTSLENFFFVQHNTTWAKPIQHRKQYSKSLLRQNTTQHSYLFFSLHKW